MAVTDDGEAGRRAMDGAICMVRRKMFVFGVDVIGV